MTQPDVDREERAAAERDADDVSPRRRDAWWPGCPLPEDRPDSEHDT